LGDDQAGFTLVELVIALGLMAIIAASLSGVFYAAMKAAGASAHRSDGASIASRELESMRSFQYSDIGFYADQTGYVATFTDPDTNQTLTTVTLGSTTPSGNPANIQPVTPDAAAATNFNPDPDPTNAQPIVQGGVKFSVQRYVGWANAADSSTTYDKAYKRTVVLVSWTDQAGTHTVHQSSIVYPGGQGKYVGPEGVASSTTTSTTMNLTPGPPTLTSVTVAGPGSLQVAWTAPTTGAAVTSYTVEYSTDPTFPANNFTAVGNPATNTLAPSQTSFTLVGLTDSTTYYVEIIAYNGTNAGNPSTPALSATTPAPPPTCKFGPLNVADAKTKSTTGTILTKQGKMTANLTLTWSTSGTGSDGAGHQCGDAFQVRSVNSGGGADPQNNTILNSGGGGAYNAVVNSQGNNGWATGVHAFTVWDSTTNSSTSVVKTFTVCAFGAGSC
jgi:prepilin-type N-terminal cleavage/methylation domain-containing protein